MDAYPIPTVLKSKFPSFLRIFNFYQNNSSCFLHRQPPIGASRRQVADNNKCTDKRVNFCVGKQIVNGTSPSCATVSLSRAKDRLFIAIGADGNYGCEVGTTKLEIVPWMDRRAMISMLYIYWTFHQNKIWVVRCADLIFSVPLILGCRSLIRRE
jgi:hypothetical protein